MSNHASGAQRAKKHADRLHWLRDNRDLLVRLPGANQDVEPDRSAALDQAVKDMKFYRLYAPTAAADGIRASIRALVSELRGEPMTHRVGNRGKRATA